MVWNVVEAAVVSRRRARQQLHWFTRWPLGLRDQGDGEKHTTSGETGPVRRGDGWDEGEGKGETKDTSSVRKSFLS